MPAKPQYFILGLLALCAVQLTFGKPAPTRDKPMRRTITRVIQLPPLPGQSVGATIKQTLTVPAVIVSNPPPSVRSNIIVSFDSPPMNVPGEITNKGSVYVLLVGNWIQSATNLNGPWTNHFFVPASGTNVSVSFPIDRSKPAKFFRLSSNVLAEITNL